MEKEKPFKLFLPPRLSGSQVSAVRPQSAAMDVEAGSGSGAGAGAGAGPGADLAQSFNERTEEDFGFSFAMTNRSRNGGNRDSDPALENVNCLPILEQNSERMNRMYSKLYEEAEKIKKWKVNIESELKQKENKLQENIKLTEALRKAIQELQFENEKVSLKLDEEIQENEDLIKENKATRRLCNAVNETCTRVSEKMKKYEHEREETRQVHMDLNNSIEKMIIAFEDLRVQAENSRLEVYFKLKEDNEKIQHLEEEYKKEVNDKESQVSLLLLQSTEKESKMKELTFLLEESRDKVNHLEERTKLQDENLKELNEKKDLLASELENIKMSLQMSMNTQKALEEDLQRATQAACQLNEDKKAQIEEFDKAKVAHSFVVTELQTTICSLEELLRTEQQRLEKNEDQLKIITMELQEKSSELEKMTTFKNNTEAEVEELKKVLREIHDFEIQLTAIATREQHYSKQVNDMKTELEKEKLKNTELTVSCDKLSLENKELAQEKSDMALELKKQEDHINDSKMQEEEMLKQIGNLEETEIQLRNELQTVKEELKEKEEEIKCKLDKSEENARSIECEVIKKDKQMKILENKCNNLRKQVENKGKHIEELQQENKALKKKGTAESKQLNAYEIKVSKLELELENSRQKFEERTQNYQKEIEDKKLSEENLLGQIEKATIRADEAEKLRKEIDLRCQHTIAEMVAVMEKHKHQYDKMVEEKDSELGLYKTKEQEQSSLRASLEMELSNLKTELLSVKKQLDFEREEKEKLKREAKVNIVTLKENDKKIQTSSLEAPESNYRKFDSKATSSRNIARNCSTDYSKSKGKRKYMWTSAQSILSTPVSKAYTVKTPTKLQMQQRENKAIGDNKKRKIFDFDANSDSSEPADLWSMVSEEDTVNNNNNPPVSHFVKTPKKTPSSVRSSASVLKLGSVKKMQDDHWAIIAKMDRKKKVKEAEKLFV